MSGTSRCGDSRRRGSCLPARRDGERSVGGFQRALIGPCDEFGSGLAGAVGIDPAELVRFAIGPCAFAVQVDLVGGHADNRLDAAAPPRRLQHVRGPHHVRGEGADRVVVTVLDERPRGEVEHDLGPSGRDQADHGREIADIGHRRCDVALDLRLQEQAVLPPVRRQPAGMDVRAPAGQPEAEPTALEARMAGHEDRSSRISGRELRRRSGWAHHGLGDRVCRERVL